MSDPLIDPSDLGTALNETDINVDRAVWAITRAQTECESVVSPLPPGAEVVVERVALRAYVSTTSGRNTPGVVAGINLQPQEGSNGMGGVWLSRTDKADLRRMAGGGGAFNIDMLPADYVPPAPFYPYSDWDQVQ